MSKNAKANNKSGKAKLVDLDKTRYDVLPKVIAEKRASLSLEEVKSLVEWKMWVFIRALPRDADFYCI